MTTVTATSTDLDAQREADRLELLHTLDQHPAEAIPCRAVDLYVSAAWVAEDDAEQRTAAAACRSRPCPALEACRAYGDAHPLELGAYGGRTQTERRKAAQRKETPVAKQRHDIGVQKKLRRQARQTREARKPDGNLDHLAAKLVRRGQASPLVLGFALRPEDPK